MSASENNQRIRLVLRSGLQIEVRDFPIDRQARGLSPTTVEWYREKLGTFARFAPQYSVPSLLELTPVLVRRYLLGLAETHSPGGVHGMFRALHALVN